MQLDKLEIQDSFILKHDAYKDERGLFYESFNQKKFSELGLELNFVQDNFSSSKAGVLRGLHIMTHHPQGKLITCLQGRIIDFILDLRPHSPSFLKFYQIELSSDRPVSFYAPAGTAHGFIALEESLISYKCTSLYQSEYDGGVHFKSGEVKLDCFVKKPLVSAKDKNLPTVQEWLKLNKELLAC